MGLSSNARLLSITARLTSNEYESQQITNSKMRLANQSQEASQNYLAALGNDQLVFMGYTAQGHETTNVLTAALLYSYGDTKNQYGIVNAAGQILIDKEDAVNFQNSATLDEFLEKNGIEKIWKDKNIQEAYSLFISDEYTTYKTAWDEVCKDVEGATYSITYDSRSRSLARQCEDSTTTTSPNITTEIVDSDTAWKLSYKSEYQKLSELVEFYNFCVKNVIQTGTYDETEFDKTQFSEYKSKYKSTMSTSPILIQGLNYEKDTNNNLGNFWKDDNFNLNDNQAQRNLDEALHEGDYDTAINFMNELYIKIKNQEDTCRSLESKDNWIENIAKKLTPAKTQRFTGENYPEFVYDSESRITEEKQEELYEKQKDKYFKESAMLNYDLTRGNNNSTIYKNYQKYLELKSDLTTMMEEFEATIENPTNCYTYSDQSQFKWYTNLWYKMNGASTRKSNEGIQQHNYKILDSNLLKSESWLQYSLRNGTVTLELASNMENISMSDLFNVSSIFTSPNELQLTNISWKSRVYSSCSDITSVQDKAKIARAEAEYERRTKEISEKDKKYQNKLKKLETEHSALQTEYESVQQALDKNIDRSYKTFNG